MPPYDSIVFPAGQACTFDLQVDLAGSNYHLKEFLDPIGNPVRLIIAGKGSLMTFTNEDDDPDTAISFKAYGFAAHIAIGNDGSATHTFTGHVLLTMLATDHPPGPSATSVGRLVLQIAANGVGTILSFSGKSTDICAALS